jgi:hypothetical protein
MPVVELGNDRPREVVDAGEFFGTMATEGEYMVMIGFSKAVIALIEIQAEDTIFSSKEKIRKKAIEKFKTQVCGSCPIRWGCELGYSKNVEGPFGLVKLQSTPVEEINCTPKSWKTRTSGDVNGS